MALSIKLTTLLFATLVCYFTRSQAAPLNISDSIVRNTRAEAVTPTMWMQDMYDCWDTDDATACNKMKMGVRSSHNSTIPEADIVEMFLSSQVKEVTTPTISYTGSTHFIEFTFNVSATPGTIQRTEVRIYHSAVASVVGCDTTNGIFLKLLAVNTQNQASVIDNVTVHLDKDDDKWVIFDSVKKYDWKFEQNNVHKLAIAVSGACSNVELNKLGFVVDNTDQNKLPLFAVFTVQERMMTEVKLLPTALVKDMLERSVEGVEQKRTIEKKSPTCHFQKYTVNFRKMGLKNIIRPAVLEMNYCTGSCRHPVAYNTKNNIYASLKAQIAQITDLENPSCVPIRYRKQPIMYLSSTGDFITIVNAEASATSCGCR